MNNLIFNPGRDVLPRIVSQQISNNNLPFYDYDGSAELYNCNICGKGDLLIPQMYSATLCRKCHKKACSLNTPSSPPASKWIPKVGERVRVTYNKPEIVGKIGTITECLRWGWTVSVAGICHPLVFGDINSIEPLDESPVSRGY